jgi:effector-binding domain-containing protein
MPEQAAEPEIATTPQQHLAVVRETVAMTEIPALFDRAFPQIFAALGRAGVAPSAAPMGVTHGMPGDTLDLSVAVPVAEPFTPDDDAVTIETLPEGPAATLLVRGDYAGIAPAYGRLFAWIEAQGRTPSGIAWEQYLTEPEPGGDPALNETLLAVALQP